MLVLLSYATSIATYANNAGVSTALQYQRTFEITGDVVASPIFFDGTGNVSFAATIQPNSVGLGTDTFGDYVKDITGTANEITVTGGTGEGSSPTLSIPNQFTAPQDVTVTRDLQVIRNLNVNGNITIGGTAATLFANDLFVFDRNIVLGIGSTNISNNDITTDNTANGGGIAIASTEGNPLVSFDSIGVNTYSVNYKQIAWFKTGTFAGLGTDAWLINYAIGIGSTQFPTGTRLAAGSVQFTENDLAVVRNINATGVVTAISFVGNLTGNTSSATYATSAGIATYADTAGVSTNVIGGIASVTSLNVTGITTLGTVEISSGIITSTTGVVTYYGDGSNLTNVVSTSGYADTAGISTISTNVIGGIASVTSLNVTGITTLTSIVGTSLSITGISTIANFLITNVGTGATVGGIGVTYYGDGSNLTNVVSTSGYANTAGISTNVIGGIASVTSLDVSGITTLASIVGTSLSITGISTLGTVEISSGIITATTGIVTYYGDGSNLTNVVSTSGYADTSGISTIATNVIGGIASVTSLDVSGITTLGSVEISSGIVTAKTGIVTYYGDGSYLTGVSALSVQQLDLTASPVYPTFANGVGSTSLGISSTQVAYMPASGNLGIGTTTPTSKLTVVGDVLVSGILTAAHIVGTSLSISGISTIANFRMSPVGTGATVGGIGVTYYGDGLNLTGIVTSIVAGTNITISGSTGQVTINSNSSGGGSISISTNTANQSQYITYVAGTGNTTGLGVTIGGLVFNPASGNLGIGTITPTSKLDVRGDVSIASTLGIGTVIDIVPYDTLNSGTLSWEGSAGQLFSITNNLTTGSIYSVNDVSGIPSIDVDANGTIQLGPYGGNIGLGTTNPTAKLHVVGDGLVSGTLSATVFTSLSDRTQKEDIRPIENAIGIVNQLTGVRYNWKNSINQPSIGLIAQDVEEVIPEVVVEMADGLKSVSYGNIVAVLIEAIKEQQVRIEELEDRLNA
jgi:hypothetical protein